VIPGDEIDDEEERQTHHAARKSDANLETGHENEVLTVVHTASSSSLSVSIPHSEVSGIPEEASLVSKARARPEAIETSSNNLEATSSESQAASKSGIPAGNKTPGRLPQSEQQKLLFQTAVIGLAVGSSYPKPYYAFNLLTSP